MDHTQFAKAREKQRGKCALNTPEAHVIMLSWEQTEGDCEEGGELRAMGASLSATR